MTDEGAATEAAASNGAGEIDPTQVDANELAKNMSQASDEQLEPSLDQARPSLGAPLLGADAAVGTGRGSHDPDCDGWG